MVVRLHMGWRQVLFANWPVDPAVVAPHLPDSLRVDTFEGDAWLSVVPFTNVDVRPAILPEGWGVSLPELNLRTYVTPDGGAAEADTTAGVYFLSLDAEGVFGVLAARVFHHLPYSYARISLSVDDGAPTGTHSRINGERDATESAGGTSDDGPSVDATTVSFRSRRRHPGARPAEFVGIYGPTGDRFAADADTLAHFLTERYRYYTEASDGTIRYADVEHEPWPLYEATVDVERNTLFAANGFDDPTRTEEAVHLYSPGVDTVASPSRRLRGEPGG